MASSTSTASTVRTRRDSGRSRLPARDGTPEREPLRIYRLGTVDYQEALDLQRRLADARKQDLIPDVLLLLEHPHTYTLGRRGNAANILLSETELEARAIAVYHVDRGGDVTYHGPGQVVGYPIFKLPPDRLDYVRYIRDVERAMLLAVRDLGVPADLKDGLSGVWAGNDKLCAIGVKVDAWGVTTHGFALNVNVDLSYFEHIIPCGLVGKGVSSLQRELGRRVAPREVVPAITRRLGEAFGLTPIRARAGSLGLKREA
ncbi:MAG TPA: lipoyl(octanoyl) transferase LipB [Chloroflexota bacterium]|nr:lipoyl(octanoyl) transferase LipB [Chloroflexota bacterium]